MKIKISVEFRLNGGNSNMQLNFAQRLEIDLLSGGECLRQTFEC